MFKFLGVLYTGWHISIGRYGQVCNYKKYEDLFFMSLILVKIKTAYIDIKRLVLSPGIGCSGSFERNDCKGVV